LALRMDGDILYVSAPDLHFLAGKPLERLKDGDTVVFIAQLSLSLDGNRTIERRQPQRFVFSYDIWEQTFKVTRMGNIRRTGLSAGAAEAWCLESLAISTSGIPQDQPVWLRLDLRVTESRDPAYMIGESGVSLSDLVKIFGRAARPAQPHWLLDRPPFRLVDLKRAENRGSRGG
jgi:hypothetical protein